MPFWKAKVIGSFIISLVFGSLVSNIFISISYNRELGKLALPQPEAIFATKSRFSVRESVRTEEIPFATETREDPKLEEGELVIEQVGEIGLKQIIEILTYYDKTIYDYGFSEQTLKQPITEIFRKGTKPKILELDTPYGKIRYAKILSNFTATSYHPFCDGCSGTGITASGMKAGYGVVAVDPKVIPLRSRIYIPGYGIAIAGDTGGAIKGNKIDLGFDEMKGQWTKRQVDVYLLVE